MYAIRSYYGYLETGSQPITADPDDLKYGVSITDPCLGWDMTASALAEAYKLLGERFFTAGDVPVDATGSAKPLPLQGDHKGKANGAAKA